MFKLLSKINNKAADNKLEMKQLIIAVTKKPNIVRGNLVIDIQFLN
jgi:hypothetical protein